MKDRTLWILLAAILVGLALKRRPPERQLIEDVRSTITFEDITPEFT